MRLSVREGDPGYKFMALTSSCTVLLNGVDVTKQCHTADEEEGKVWRVLHDQFGRSYMDRKTGNVAEEMLSGKVEIIIHPSHTTIQ